MTQAVHGKARYRDTIINVGCLMSNSDRKRKGGN